MCDLPNVLAASDIIWVKKMLDIIWVNFVRGPDEEKTSFPCYLLIQVVPCLIHRGPLFARGMRSGG
jgi:hypothetical protein